MEKISRYRFSEVSVRKIGEKPIGLPGEYRKLIEQSVPGYEKIVNLSRG